VRSDDGFSLRIGGQEIMGFERNRSAGTDSRRASFLAPGVYPFEFFYWDLGVGQVLEAYYLPFEMCFPLQDTAQLEPGCASNSDLTDVRGPISSGLRSLLRELDFDVLERPSWLTDTSDPAFALADESCGSQRFSATCGGLVAYSCGNGVRELSNIGSLTSPMFRVEECDDGNRDSGDGCSSECTTEGGFSCTEKAVSFCSPLLDGGTPDGGLPGDSKIADAGSSETAAVPSYFRIGCRQSPDFGLVVLVLLCRRRS
jgi:cysteine-rich repeat protein